MNNKKKIQILKRLGKQDILIVPYKWGIIWNWKGWKPLKNFTEVKKHG